MTGVKECHAGEILRFFLGVIFSPWFFSFSFFHSLLLAFFSFYFKKIKQQVQSHYCDTSVFVKSLKTGEDDYKVLTVLEISNCYTCPNSYYLTTIPLTIVQYL